MTERSNDIDAVVKDQKPANAEAESQKISNKSRKLKQKNQIQRPSQKVLN